MNDVKKQEALIDKSSTGKERPWTFKKCNNQLLSLAYDEIDIAKAERLRDCASFLTFSVLQDNSMKLKTMNSCRVRLCPMCSWRRSLKIFSHTQKIMAGMKSEKEYCYIFLTLTIKNCEGEQLNDNIDNMMKAWHRFIINKKVKQCLKGWYRGFEVTHDVFQFITSDMWYGNSKLHLKPRADYYKKLCLNIGDLNPNFDTYHPHFHCIFAVNKNYFKSVEYIKQEDWAKYWAKAMRLDYIPLVDIRKVKGDTAKAVSEVAKYAVKDGDYIIPDDWDLTINTVRLLDKILVKRRFVAYGGKFKEWHKKLNLDDENDGDLIHVDSDDSTSEETKLLVTYVWNTGYNQYYKES